MMSSLRISQKLKSIFWIVVVIGILILSWIGLSEMYPETNTLRYLPDRIYRILKIVTGNDPLSPVEPKDIPWTLIGVKILVTILLLRAMYKLVQSVFFEQYTQLKSALKQQHLIVIGIGDKGERILNSYQQATGKTAVAIEQQAEHRKLEDLRRLGHAVIIGDATEQTSLYHANIRRASTLICFIKNEQNAIQVASQFNRIIAQKQTTKKLTLPSPVECFIHLSNPRLVTIFQRHGQENATSLANIRFFNMYNMIARRFFYQLPQDITPILQRSDAHISMILWGFDDITQTLLVQGLNTFHLLPSQTSEWLIFCKNAKQMEQLFLDKYPKLNLLTQHTSIKAIKFIEDTEQYASLIDQYINSPTLQENALPVVICASGNDKKNLATAVEILHNTSSGYPLHNFLIYVLNSETHAINELIRGTIRERLRFFGDTNDYCNYPLITGEKQDNLAKAIHQDYLRQLGQSADRPTTMSESQYYQTEWDKLNEDAKDANRMQADHIIYKIILTNQLDNLTNHEPIAFSDHEVEQLAMTEHARWSAHRYLRGWDTADRRDDNRKLHPSLVDWNRLNEIERQKDRDTILRIPQLIKTREDIAL